MMVFLLINGFNKLVIVILMLGIYCKYGNALKPNKNIYILHVLKF